MFKVVRVERGVEKALEGGVEKVSTVEKDGVNSWRGFVCQLDWKVQACLVLFQEQVGRDRKVEGYSRVVE